MGTAGAVYYLTDNTATMKVLYADLFDALAY